MLKPWPCADSPILCREPLPPAAPPDRGDPPLLWVFPSPAQVYLLTDIWGFSPAPQASDLIPKQVLLLLPWASPQRAYSLISRCPGSMAWPPVPLLYGPLSCRGLYLVARNPTPLYLPALPAGSVALASITYLLASSPSDKRPLLAPLG